MTQSVSSAGSTSFAGELAVLLIENESARAESAKQQREAARAAFLDNAQQQVEALHAAANATMSGALISASFTMAAGACQIGAASFQYQVDMGKAHGACSSEIASDQLNASILGDLGDVSSKLSDPSRLLIGESTAARFQAEAKRYETLGEQAKWQASDAGTEIDKAEKRGDKVLDLLQGMQQDDRSSATAIIGRI